MSYTVLPGPAQQCAAPHCVLHTAHCTPCTSRCTPYAFHCALHAARCILHCRPHIAHRAPHTAHCTLHIAYIVHICCCRHGLFSVFLLRWWLHLHPVPAVEMIVTLIVLSAAKARMCFECASSMSSSNVSICRHGQKSLQATNST